MTTKDVSNLQLIEPLSLFEETQSVINKLCTELGAPVITYWNHISYGGLTINDTYAMYKILERIGFQEKLYLFIKSSSGDRAQPLRFINLIRSYCKELIVLIPLECESAATMVAIGSDKILMGPVGFMTPINNSTYGDLDPVADGGMKVSVSMANLRRIVKHSPADNTKNPYESLYGYFHPYVIADAERIEDLCLMICEELLNFHIKDRKKASEISATLNLKYPSTGYPIFLQEAKNIGLKAEPMPARVNELLFELHDIYRAMGIETTVYLNKSDSYVSELLCFIETQNIQTFYQKKKDWVHRLEEEYIPSPDDRSGWIKTELIDGKVEKLVIYTE
jgi:hypothetical protein